MLRLFYWLSLYGGALVAAVLLLYRALDLIRGPRPNWRRALNELVWTAIPVAVFTMLVLRT